MAYRAEIEIGVKGLQQLKNFQKTIKELSTQVDLINDLSKQFELPIQNIEAYNRNLQITAKTLKEVRIGSEQEADAIKDYVAALGQANAARDRQNKLIEEQISLQEFARKGQGPSSPTALSSPLPAFVGPRQATSSQTQAAVTQGVREMEEVYASLDRIQAKQVTRENERVEALGRGTQEVLELARAAKMGPKLPPGFNFKEAELRVKTRLAEDATIKQINKRRVQERELLSTQITYDLKATQARLDNNDKVFKDRIRKNKQELDDFDRRLRQRDQARASRSAARRDALGSAIIGGAFPLLFGQGAGAAVGGGLGGAAGGLIGGQFGFGLSLVGTALGTAVDSFSKQLTDLAKALDKPSEGLSALQEAGIKVSDATKEQIATLEEAGQVYDAQTVLFAEITERLGEDAVAQLNALSQATDKLDEEMSKAKSQLMAEMIPSLVVFTNTLAGVVSVLNKLSIPKSFADLIAGTVAGGGAFGAPATALIGGQISAFGASQTTGEGPDRSEALNQQKTINRIISNRLELINNERDLLKSTESILNDSVYAERERQIIREWELKEQNLILSGKGTEEEVTKLLLEMEKKLAKLANERSTAEERAARAKEQQARRQEADLQRQLRAQRQISRQLDAAKISEINVLKDRFAFSVKLAEFQGGEEAALDRRLRQLVQERDGQLEILNIQTKQKMANIKSREERNALINAYNMEYSLIESQYNLEYKTTLEKQKQLQVVKQIQALTAAAGFDPLALAERTQPFASRGIYGAPEGLMDFSTGAELNAIVKQEVALARVLEKYQEIGQAAQLTSELVTTGFQDMLTGTKSAEEVFANFLRNLAEMLIKTAQQMIATYIAIGIARAFGLGQSPSIGTRASDFNLTGFGNLESTGGNVFAGFTPRANGGPVSTGTPYMVGERGPELFVPKSSGTIVPNNALGGDVNVVVNVTETQTDTRGNGARANQVGNALAAAVQAEIIKQKRPGGLLAN